MTPSLRLVLLLLLSCAFLTACQKRTRTGQEPFPGLPADLQAVLWAESPMLYNPTNLDVDARGRIWVTEAVNYRNYNNDSTGFPHYPQGDRIVILEDSDGDGKADKSTVFVQDKDLVSPLGIAVIGKKVYVSCSPHLIVYTDEDGDDVPDGKEILLTGFGGVDHDHSLHALLGGPDGNLYFTTGNAGPHRVTDRSGWTLRSGSIYTGGSPYNTVNQGNMKSDDGKIWVGGLTLRIDPAGENMKVLAHNFRNSYEVFVDSRGDMWQNDNDDQVVTCRTSWVMEGGNAGYFSADGTRYWQADHRPWQDVFTAHWHQEDPGVMPAGDRTGAGAPTGIVLIEDAALGEAYHGMLLSADAGRNTIFSYRPEREASGFALRDRKNFITSLPADNPGYVWNDSANSFDQNKWFRPSDVAIGIDGSLFIADWYDPVVGGHLMQDTTAYGRIYRIVPKDKALLIPSVDFTTTEGQIKALKNPAVNVRFEAFTLLRKQGAKIIGQVKELVNDENPFVRYRAVWLMAQLGNQGQQEVEQLLSHKDEEIRVVALRALRQVRESILPLARRLSGDNSAAVRREVLLAISDVPYEEKRDIVLSFIQEYPAGDPWYLDALGLATSGNENDVYAQLSVDDMGKKLSPVKWPESMSRIMWRLHPSDAIAEFETRASTDTLDLTRRLEALTALAFIPETEAARAMLRLTDNPTATVREQAAYWASFRQGNDWYGLVDWRGTSLDAGYEQKLAMMKVKMSMALNDELPSYERNKNAAELARDVVGAQMLLTQVREGIFPEELLPAVEAAITENPDMGIRVQAMNYFGALSATRLSVSDVVAIAGDGARGKSVFEKSCLSCHAIHGKGGVAGPDLAEINQKFDQASLLDAIINPDAGIVFGYEPWTITMRDGSSYYGFLIADGEKTAVIRNLAGERHALEAANIVSRKKEDGSVMPEPADLGMQPSDVADVAAYLMSLRK